MSFYFFKFFFSIHTHTRTRHATNRSQAGKHERTTISNLTAQSVDRRTHLGVALRSLALSARMRSYCDCLLRLPRRIAVATHPSLLGCFPISFLQTCRRAAKFTGLATPTQNGVGPKCGSVCARGVEIVYTFPLSQTCRSKTCPELQRSIMPKTGI